MKKLKSYIFYVIFVFFSLVMISSTWQMLNPKEVSDFIISIVMVAWYGPWLVLFGLATWLFWCSLRKNYTHSNYWSIIRLLPLVPILILALIWIWSLL